MQQWRRETPSRGSRTRADGLHARTLSRSRRFVARAGLLCLALLPLESAFGQTGASRLPPEVAGLLIGAVFMALVAVVIWLGLSSRRNQPVGYLYRVTRNERPWLRMPGQYRFAIRSDMCRIGRHPGNEIVIEDKSVSRLHAHLVRHINGTFSIYDAGSKNGVKVGNRSVVSSFLHEGDFVDLGNIRFKFTRLPRDYKAYGDTKVLPISHDRYKTRRRHEYRTDFVSRVRLYNDDMGWINGWMRNAGRDGAYIEMDMKLPSRLPLDIVVSVTEGTKHKWLHLSAEVVWSDPKGAGIRFMDVDTSSIDRVINMSETMESDPAGTAAVSSGRTLH